VAGDQVELRDAAGDFVDRQRARRKRSSMPRAAKAA